MEIAIGVAVYIILLFLLIRFGKFLKESDEQIEQQFRGKQ